MRKRMGLAGLLAMLLPLAARGEVASGKETLVDGLIVLGRAEPAKVVQ